MEKDILDKALKVVRLAEEQKKVKDAENSLREIAVHLREVKSREKIIADICEKEGIELTDELREELVETKSLNDFFGVMSVGETPLTSTMSVGSSTGIGSIGLA